MDFRLRPSAHGVAVLFMALIASCAGPSTTRCGSFTYPQDLERDGVEGDVVLRLALDSSGKVTDAAVVESSNPRLNQPAIDRFLHEPACRFQPAIDRDGRPVPYVLHD